MSVTLLRSYTFCTTNHIHNPGVGEGRLFLAHIAVIAIRTEAVRGTAVIAAENRRASDSCFRLLRLSLQKIQPLNQGDK